MRAEDAVGRILAAAPELGFPDLPAERAARLLAHLEAVLEENARVNLVGPTDLEAALARHVLDGLAIGRHLQSAPLPAGASVADLGTGGGFPGVVLAIARPDLEVHLVEGRSRKTAAIARTLEGLGLDHPPRIHTGRFHELFRSGAYPRGGFDLVLARAVARLPELVAEAAPSLAPGGHLVFWKSGRLDAEERASGAARARRRGLAVLDELSYEAAFEGRLVRYRRPESARRAQP